MHPSEFQELLKRFSEGDCTPDEEKFIIDWYQNISQPGNKRLEEPEKSLIQKRLWLAINPHPVKKRKPILSLRRAAIISIPLLACIGFYLHQETNPLSAIVSASDAFITKTSDTRIYNDGTTGRRITLPDGSEVILQPASEVIVNEAFLTTAREVRLKGEAFFTVRRLEGKAFLVFTNEVVTRVLGTSFNIRAYEDDSEITVAVKTGKVSVFSNRTKRSGKDDLLESGEVILTPNQQVVYHRVRAQVTKQLVEEPEIILPDSNAFQMQFENAEVGRIFKALAKNYGVEIRYDEDLMKNCRLTTFMSEEGLYERIEVICKAIGASYAIEDAVISIQSDGCD